MAEPCLRMADDDAWERWLVAGLPDELRTHAADCATCAAQIATFDELRGGFEAMKAVPVPDLTADIMVEVDRAPKRRSWWPAVAVAIAAGAAMFMLRAEGIELTPVPTATLIAGASPEKIDSSRSVALPFEVVTASHEEAVAKGSNWHARIQPGSYAAFRRGEDMDKKKLALGGAAVLIALYTGSIVVVDDTGSVEAKAPAELAIDADGRVSKNRLPDEAVAEHGRSRATTATSALGAGGADSKAEQPSGAYWSEEAKAMQFAIDGELFDAVSGVPVTNFEIRAEVEEATGFGRSQTTLKLSDREDGKFRLDDLGLGTWRVTALAEGYAPVTQTVDLTGVDSDPYLVFPMSGGGRVSGRVVDWRDKPVEGARVGLDACFVREADGCQIVASDDDGSFTIERVPADEVFAIRAQHERYGMAVARNLRRAEGETEHVTVRLSGILKMYGQVTRGETKRPVDGMTVLSTDADIKTVTDAEGRYTFFVPLTTRPGVQVVTTGKSGREAKFASYPTRRSARPIQWVQAETHVAEAEQDFRLGMSTARVFGRVTSSDGTPVTNAAIGLQNTTGWAKQDHNTFPEETTTDADGRYAIDEVPHQAGYRVTLGVDGERTPLGYVNVKDETEVEANFDVGAGRIRGRFVDAETKEPFRASSRSCTRIGARRIDGDARYILPRCFDDGRFEFAEVPAGRYTIENRVEWMNSPVEFHATTVTVQPKETVEGVTVEVIGEPSKDYRVRVLDLDGRFVMGTYVRYKQGKTSFSSNLEVGHDGVAKISLSGSFDRFFIDAPGYESQEVLLAGRSTEQIIVVTLKKSQ